MFDGSDPTTNVPLANDQMKLLCCALTIAAKNKEDLATEWNKQFTDNEEQTELYFGDILSLKIKLKNYE